MKGKVSCLFVGGPKGEETLDLPAFYCQDTFSFVNDAWMAQGRDGSVNIMMGPIPQHAPWIHFTKDIFEKVKPVVPGHVTYKFVRTEMVNRCETVLEQKGRRCRNEAEAGTNHCRVHNKPAP